MEDDDIGVDEERDERGLVPCTSCGRCCSGPDGWITLGGNDLQGVSSPDFERLTREHEDSGVYTRVMRQRQDGSCLALDRTADGRFLCTIYESRPAVCRFFGRGSAECRDTYFETYREEGC